MVDYLIMKIFSIATLCLFLISCNSEQEYKVDSEYSWWGEDIVYNDSSLDLILTLYYNNSEYTFNIQSGFSHKFYHPNYDFHICITNVSDSLKIEFTDGTEMKARRGDKLIYSEYTKEEIDYWIDIEGKKYLEEDKYPIYHYKIYNPNE